MSGRLGARLSWESVRRRVMKKKFPKEELAESGSVAQEKKEGAPMIKKELREGTEAHPKAAKQALKQLGKRGKRK